MPPARQQRSNENIVCRFSRGIDSAYAEHVVLFDFPRDPSEYVRRVGRTARGASGRGTVTVLALGRQVRRRRCCGQSAPAIGDIWRMLWCSTSAVCVEMVYHALLHASCAGIAPATYLLLAGVVQVLQSA